MPTPTIARPAKRLTFVCRLTWLAPFASAPEVVVPVLPPVEEVKDVPVGEAPNCDFAEFKMLCRSTFTAELEVGVGELEPARQVSALAASAKRVLVVVPVLVL